MGRLVMMDFLMSGGQCLIFIFYRFLTDVLPTPFNENAFSAAIGNISNTAQAYKLLNESSLLSDVLQWNATDSGGVSIQCRIDFYIHSYHIHLSS